MIAVAFACACMLSTSLPYRLLRIQRKMLVRSYCSECFVVEKEAEVLDTIKKSKFIGRIASANSFEEASKYIDNMKRIHSKANHNCWAYRSATTSRCCDDGEPGGTAGRPILNILEAENMINTVVVVTRYFGGIKLGAGGLSRAYGGTAKLALETAGKQRHVRTVVVTVDVQLNDLGSVHKLIGHNQEASKTVVKMSEEFIIPELQQHTDSVRLKLAVPVDFVTTFRSRIADVCRGRENIEVEVVT